MIDDYHDFVGLFEYWWTHGLISDLTYHNLRITCEFVSSEHPSPECSKAIEAADKEQGDIDPYSIYTVTCKKEAAALRSRFLRVRHVSFFFFSSMPILYVSLIIICLLLDTKCRMDCIKFQIIFLLLVCFIIELLICYMVASLSSS